MLFTDSGLLIWYKYDVSKMKEFRNNINTAKVHDMQFPRMISDEDIIKKHCDE